MKKITLLFAILFVATISIAQDLNLAQFSSESYFPEEINHDASKKLKNTYEKYLDLYKDEKVKYNKEQFIYETNYFLNNLNRSGHVFFGDEISNYLNELKSFIIQDENLNKKVKVYLTDYPVLNAFTNDFGNIYINIYSLAALDSEEQILYLLAHEIAHVKMRHSHKTMEFHEKIKGKNDWNEDEDDTRFKRHEFSREHEFEADSLAIELLKGRVNPDHCIELLKELKHASDPVLQTEQSIKLFSDKNQILFDSLFNAIAQDSLYFPIPESDTMSTHPSVENRIEKIKEYAKKTPGKSNYTSSGKHTNIKLLASFVLIDSYISNYYFLEAFDLIQKLINLYPNNLELKKQLSKSLTLMVESKYEGSIYTRYLNDSECSDIPFLALKKLYLSLSATDVNILALDALRGINSIVGVLNELKYSNLYLFKYNEDLFVDTKKDKSDTLIDEVLSAGLKDTLKNNQFKYIQDSVVYYTYLDTIQSNFENAEQEKKDEDIFYDEITPLDSLIKLGYVYTSPNDTCLFLANFISNNPVDTYQDSLIKDYVSSKGLYKRKKFNQELEDLLMHPGFAHRKFFRGKYTQNTVAIDPNKTLLLSSDNTYFKSKSMKNFELDEKKSLELTSKMTPIYSKYAAAKKDLSIQLNNKYSMSDLKARQQIVKWLNVSTDRKTVQYLPEDEFVLDYFNKNDIDHLVYTILVVNINQKRGHMTNINYYDVFINTKNSSLAYYARIASKNWPNIFQLEQMVYLSTQNRK
jgi:hypothetical protein